MGSLVATLPSYVRWLGNQTGLHPEGPRSTRSHHQLQPAASLEAPGPRFSSLGKAFPGHLPTRWPLPDGAHPPLQQQEAVTTVQPHGSCRMSTNGPRAGVRSPQPARGRRSTSVCSPYGRARVNICGTNNWEQTTSGLGGCYSTSVAPKAGMKALNKNNLEENKSSHL